MDAYKQGWKSYFKHKSRDSNPYHPVLQAVEYMDWNVGWSIAQEQHWQDSKRAARHGAIFFLIVFALLVAYIIL